MYTHVPGNNYDVTSDSNIAAHPITVMTLPAHVHLMNNKLSYGRPLMFALKGYIEETDVIQRKKEHQKSCDWDICINDILHTKISCMLGSV